MTTPATSPAPTPTASTTSAATSSGCRWDESPDTRPFEAPPTHGKCRCPWCIDPDDVRDMRIDDARRIF